VTKMLPRKRMTRKQLASHLREHGFPIGNSTLDKLCMPTVNEGPPVAGWWGRRPLYDPDEAIAWAEARTRQASMAKSPVGPAHSTPRVEPRDPIRRAPRKAEGPVRGVR